MPARRSPAAFAFLLAALALVGGAACTSSTWDTAEINATTTTVVYPRTDRGVRDSLIAYLTESPGSDLGQWVPPRPEAECAAERAVRRIGSERMFEIGFDAQDPSLALQYAPDERTAMVNILEGCVDFSEAVVSLLSSYQKLGMAQSACIAEGFGRLGLNRYLAGSLVDGTEPDPFADTDRYAAGVSTLAVQCLTDEDLAPAGPLPRLPGPVNPTTSTTTTEVLYDDGDDLDGIEPGGPLDTVVTTAPPTTTP